MRRALAVVVGACAAVALAGVAGATTHPTARPDPAPALTPEAAASVRTTAEPPVRPAAPSTSRTEALPAPRSRTGPPGHLPIGTLEQVDRALGYSGAEHSATFRYPGSRYVKLHFNRLLLLPGDYPTVADPSGAEVHRMDSGPIGGAAGEGRGALHPAAPRRRPDGHRDAQRPGCERHLRGR
ncbi:hypothetical protein [Micromonospora sp. NPDC049679]|uniref:hypothetical protein n=1 Tax=Micromonospora sp. NPDC049679 TaxID=3155920 RepID=UPI0033CF3DDD